MIEKANVSFLHAPCCDIQVGASGSNALDLLGVIICYAGAFCAGSLPRFRPLRRWRLRYRESPCERRVHGGGYRAGVYKNPRREHVLAPASLAVAHVGLPVI